MSATKAALSSFLSRWTDAAVEQLGHFPMIEHDGDWPSDCELADTLKGNMIQWKPVERDDSGSFDNIADALGMTFHPDIVDFYSSFFADNIFAHHSRGHLQLLQAWSEDDFERLQQNLVGHVLMKRNLKQDETIFIALTDEDDFVITVVNATGEVWLEQVGKKPQEKLADSLAEFIAELKPTLESFEL